jgi:ribosomal protein S27AE
LAIALFASTPAFASNDSRAFPPDNCTTGSPFMGFTGVNGSNTFCNSGQDILSNAIPTCAAGQIVAHDGSKFYCKAELNVPTCTPGTFLSFDGTNYTCASTGVATCGANQVLTFNGTSYYCVNKDATIPVCAANQFLTYNGSYQCAAVNTPVIPNCGAGQYVAGNGSQLYCANLPATQTVVVSCPLQYVDAANDSFGCQVQCPAGYTVTGGGFSAPGVAQFGHGHYSMPYGNGWIANVGQIFSCTSGSPPCDGNPSAYAVCMKNFP